MVRLLLAWLLLGPLFGLQAQSDSGLAGCYGETYTGHTASGELYDPRAFTAAHRTLRFGVRLLVTNPANGRSVVVKVNDRGPQMAAWALDLTPAAAAVLGMAPNSVVRVEFRALLSGEQVGLPREPPAFFQLGAFRTEGNAQALVRALIRKGFEPWLRKDGVLYRVYLSVAEPDTQALIERLNRSALTFLQIMKEPPGTLLKLSTE